MILRVKSLDEKISAIVKSVYNSLTACQTFSHNEEYRLIMFALGQAAANMDRVLSMVDSGIAEICLNYIYRTKEAYNKSYQNGDVVLSQAIESLNQFKRSLR